MAPIAPFVIRPSLTFSAVHCEWRQGLAGIAVNWGISGRSARCVGIRRELLTKGWFVMARRQHHDRLGALALVAASLLVAAAQQPLSAAEKTRRVNAAPVPVAPPAPAPAATPPAGGGPDTAGYWIVGVDGGIYSFGAAPFKGSTGAIKLNKPMVGMAPTPSGQEIGRARVGKECRSRWSAYH